MGSIDRLARAVEHPSKSILYSSVGLNGVRFGTVTYSILKVMVRQSIALEIEDSDLAAYN